MRFLERLSSMAAPWMRSVQITVVGPCEKLPIDSCTRSMTCDAGSRLDTALCRSLGPIEIRDLSHETLPTFRRREAGPRSGWQMMPQFDDMMIKRDGRRIMSSKPS